MVDLRKERGKEIADQGNQIRKVSDTSFKVRSQLGNRVYEVKSTPKGMTCTCPDFVYRGGKCKHIMATRYYLEVVPYRKNATGKAGGSPLWKKMYHFFQLNRDEFMEHYYKRSNIEATNAGIKRKFGETLKSKNPVAQVKQTAGKNCSI